MSAHVRDRLSSQRNTFRRLFLLLGPGLITGASDDDPSGIATYAQAGAAFGVTTLWMALFTLPMMCAVQFMSAKVGMVTGDGLARVLRKHYPGWVLYSVVFALGAANTINAGVDLGAIAAATNLLVAIPNAALVPAVAVLILGLQIFGSYRLIAKTFKWLTFALLAYIAAAFMARPRWHEVLVATVLPTIHVDRSFFSIVVAILGTTITPYLFFWQADQEVEEETAMGRRSRRERLGATRTELRDARWDVAVGMVLSNVVMYFIILATASTLGPAGIKKIQSATQAAKALRPLAGPAAEWLWAAALIGAGVLAVPILTGSTAFAITEAFGRKRGLSRRPMEAKLFYGVIIGSTLVGMMINFAGINPIDALVWTAVINGFLAPPLLLILMLVANNGAVLGREVNGRFTNAVGWMTTFAMFAAAIALIVYR